MNQDQQLQQRVKQSLDQQQIDDDTRIALGRARNRALESADPSGIPRWLPAGALAGLVLVVAGYLLTSAPPDDALPQLSADELAVIASEDELELLEEYEFYLWFDADEQA